MAKVSKKEVDLLKKSRLSFGEKAQLTWKRMVDNKINYGLNLIYCLIKKLTSLLKKTKITTKMFLYFIK